MTMARTRRGGLLARLRRRNADPASAQPALPDPALPPSNRGDWDQAALTNVDITEKVKSQIHTRTRPWEK